MDETNSTQANSVPAPSFPDNLSEISRILADGGVILYPTDTIWGIGCDATREDAIRRIYSIKNREPGKPFIVLVSDVEMLKQYVSQIHPRIETLLTVHTRPLTVIYRKGIHLPDIALGPNGTVAIRICQDDFGRQLIREFGKPLISTSANISEQDFPQHFGDISSQVIEKMDYIVHHRREDRSEREPSL